MENKNKPEESQKSNERISQRLRYLGRFIVIVNIATSWFLLSCFHHPNIRVIHDIKIAVILGLLYLLLESFFIFYEGSVFDAMEKICKRTLSYNVITNNQKILNKINRYYELFVLIIDIVLLLIQTASLLFTITSVIMIDI